MRVREFLAHLLHPRRSNNYRPKLLQVEGLVSVFLLVAGFGLLFHSSVEKAKLFDNILGYASDISVSQVVELTNQERAKSGLGQLTLNAQLSQAANEKAKDMFSNQYWSHTSPSGLEPWDFITGAGYSYRVAGENLARDFSTTRNMVDAWMASPTHRDNIMHSRYQEIGVAVVNGTLNGVETTLVVQMFGAPRSEQVAQVPTGPSVARAEASEGESVKAQPTQEANQPQPESQPTPNQQEDQNQETSPPPLEPTTNLDNTNSQPAPETVTRKPTPPTQPERLRFRSEPNQSIIAQLLVPVGTIEPHLLYSPLAIIKAFGLSMIFLIVFVLFYDLYVTNNQKTVRLVGKNFAHIMYLLVVAFLIIYFKGGVVQ